MRNVYGIMFAENLLRKYSAAKQYLFMINYKIC